MSLITKTQGNILPDDVKRLVDIFNKQNWKLDPSIEQTENHRQIFDKFCEFLDLLSKEEKDLIFTLTEDYLHIHFSIYPTLLKRSLLEIPDLLIATCNNIYLAPLISPKDFGKTKSSTSILYPCLHEVIPTIDKLNKKNPKSYDNPNLIVENHKNRENSLILLLDDFIGSGDTALEAIDYFNNTIRNETDTIVVISLVAQVNGASRIENEGYQIFCNLLRERAILDCDKIKDKFLAIRILRRIEKRMGIKKPNINGKDYRLGYKQTQATVSMIRTPNNTLPIYWWKTKPNGEKWKDNYGIFRR